MSEQEGWAAHAEDVLADLGRSGSGRVRVVRGPGVLGVRPLLVARDVAPAIVEAPELREVTTQNILQATDISHPGWTRIFGALKVGRSTCVAMELVAGCAVDDVASGSLTVQTVEHVASKAAGVLESLHRGRDALGRPRRLVHGSVTPDKLMLSFAGDVKLLDFGVTRTTPRALAAPETWPDALSPWVPPEMRHGADPTPASDLYMLGATIYLLLAGQPPYPPGTGFEPGAWAELEAPSKLRDEVRPSLDDLVMSMLDPDPGRRPVSAQQVIDTIDARPARLALSAVVKDAVPERLHWLEELEQRADSEPPLVFAEAVEEDPSARRRIPQPILRDTDLDAEPPPRRRSSPRTAPRPLPAFNLQPVGPTRPPPGHVGHDSVEILRASVKRLFDTPLPRDARALFAASPPLALPPGIEDTEPPIAVPVPEDAAVMPPDVLTLPGLSAPSASWRRPLGLLMILGAALAMTVMTEARPESGVLDLRIDPPTAAVEVVDHPSAGALATLPPGIYRIRAHAPGHQETEIAVQLDPGEHRVVLLDLPPEAAE